VTITMEADYKYYLDAYLELYGTTCQLLDDDDNGGGGTTARIEYTLPTDGTYTIAASSANPWEMGAYEIDIELDNEPPDFGDNCESDTWTTPFDVWSGAFGDSWSLSSDYDDEDGPRGYGYYLDDVEIIARVDDVIDVRMWSDDFDTYLLLLDDACNIVAEDDNGYGSTHSRLTYSVPTEGVYTIIFTSSSPASTGDFEYYVDSP